MTAPRVPTYQLLIDWDNDANFTGSEDDVSSMVAADPPPSVLLGSDQLRERTPPMIGSARFELMNRDQRFSAEFPGSPIYGLLLPGRPVELRVVFGEELGYDHAGYTYDNDGSEVLYDGRYELTMFTGVIDEPVQIPDPLHKRVAFDCFGNLSKLRGHQISTQLYESIAVGTAIGHVLDAAGWPAGDRDIDTGQTTLLYWWLADEDAMQALVDLLTIEGAGAKLYEDGDGVLHFEDREYRSTATRSTTSQVTFDSSAADPVFHVAPFRYSPGFRDVVNECQVEAVRRSVASLAVIWTYGQNITIGASASVIVRAKLSDPAKNVVCVNATDVTVSAGSIASVSLSRTSGGVFDITLTAGVGGATVNLLRLRGESATVAATYLLRNTIDTSASQARYGVRSLTITSLSDIDPNAAQDLADAMVNRYMEPLAQVEITLKNHDSAHLFQQLFRRVSDRITVVEPHTGVDHDFWIERIAHSMQQAGNLLVTTFGCSKVAEAAGDLYFYDDADAVYDTALYGS